MYDVPALVAAVREVVEEHGRQLRGGEGGLEGEIKCIVLLV